MSSMLFSPLDVRYARDLPASLSEDAVLSSQIAVEKAYLLSLMDEGLCPRIDERDLDPVFQGVTFGEIEEIERRTQHATRALVEVLAERLRQAGHPKCAEWVHVGITSFDTVDTAQRLRIKTFFVRDAWPAIDALKKELQRWAHLHRDTLQVGRTHGQWAVPSLFGLIFAEAHERIDALERRLKHDINDLRGQASGAVGGYQALSLLVKDPLSFETKFLNKLGLKPHLASTQILPPEDIMALAHDFYNLCSVVAKLATDLRHLARSEIAEIAEGMAPGQVGSSTMPQKRNPWNLEHVCSLYKILSSRLHLMQIDLVSEHQRDLTNSASSRFYGETFAMGYLMVKRLTRVLTRLEVFPENMSRHMESAGSSIFAEAFYVLATKNGIAHAHDLVREASRESESLKKPLVEIAIGKGILQPGTTVESLRADVLKGPRSKLDTLFQKWRSE